MQGILGTTLTRPLFQVELDRDSNEYKIYFGLLLFTTIPNNKHTLIFKTTIAILVGAGVCRRHIQNVFKLSFVTIQRYVDAVTTSDTDAELLSKLKNPGRTTYKVTKELAEEIYSRAQYHQTRGEYQYIHKTIQDIQDKFGIKLSREKIRTELKKHLTKSSGVASEATVSLKCGDSKRSDTGENLPLPFTPANIPMRNNHAGLLMLNAQFILMLGDFPEMVTEEGRYEIKALLVWFLIGVLAGAVNFEGHRHLNIPDFEFVTGFAGIPGVEKMREIFRELGEIQEVKITTILLQKNIDYFVMDEDDYYADGHFEEYTGNANILTGWSTIRNRVLPGNSDYMVHDAAGNAVFSLIFDLFEDFREVLVRIVDKIKKLRPDRTATLIYDRGGFSTQLMREITDVHNFHFITWQKGFKREEADGLDFNESMMIQLPYNDLGKFRNYKINYAQDEWECKGYRCRRIVIRREDKREKEKGFYQSILTSDWDRDGAAIIRRILGRTVQENDFKKQKKHFGLDEITSYGKLNYGALNDKAQEKTVKSRSYEEKLEEIRVLKMERDKLFAKLGLGVFKESSLKTIPSNVLRKHKVVVEQIKECVADIALKKIEIKCINKDISKLAKCRDEKILELDLRPKRLMNLIKICARNIFEAGAREFLNTYKNLRDYQKVFRKLTRSGGEIERRGNILYVKLDSFGRGKFREKCNEYLEKMNDKQIMTMDGKYTLRFKPLS